MAFSLALRNVTKRRQRPTNLEKMWKLSRAQFKMTS